MSNKEIIIAAIVFLYIQTMFFLHAAESGRCDIQIGANIAFVVISVSIYIQEKNRK